MRELPILFNGPMVRAILEGRKTQTRRPVKGWALEWLQAGMFTPEYVALPSNHASPFGFAGDRLWVRETWGYSGCRSSYPANTHGAFAHYHADGARREIPFATAHEMELAMPKQVINFPSGFDELDEHEQRWKADELLTAWWDRKKKIPSIHMPRWASRLLLEVTSLRVQRLHDIEHEDCIAEGCAGQGRRTSDPRQPTIYPVDEFVALWKSLSGAESWESNPWVWVVEFKLLEANRG